MYGRRRVGKTETLRQFCKGKQHIFFSCRECTDKLQLKSFSEKILRENIPASSYITEFADWDRAFRCIADLPYGNSKKLVVIDEFPYMCKGNESIPLILQNLWDELFKDENVMIVLCGSAMSFIEKELLAEKNPLYGRATGIYKMKEMNFYEAIQFFPDYSNYDICIEFVRRQQRENKLPFRYSKIGRWWGKTTVRCKEDKTEVRETEIDILAVSKHLDSYILGECKFKASPFSYTEYLNTKSKMLSQQEKADFYF